jgi:hypothetical protein
MNLNGYTPTTDPVGDAPPEALALRAMREAKALAERLKRELKAEREGGPKASKW